MALAAYLACFVRVGLLYLKIELNHLTCSFFSYDDISIFTSLVLSHVHCELFGEEYQTFPPPDFVRILTSFVSQ